MQPIAWQISLVLMALVAFGFAFVAINSGRRQEDYSPLQKSAYRLRSRLFWGLVLVFGPAMIYTLFELPYDAARANTGAGPVQVVDATGYQWRWELSQDQFAVGQPVEFRVTSADVNHGFGIYDANLHLVAQTQAMPGYTNTLRHTFSEEGTYKILCMEYCGLAHHNMLTEIRVGAQ
ncbi:MULTISPECIES: cytochrome-c oxidase [Aromatoleum]|uniref:Cytochrome C oxidase subunit II n=2 Tax=Aromatoleum TaxID=551759 RepID=A0ABX1NSU9_9RHOO|nr:MULTISPECIES: cytochrome-c oxidase [Aromatoleum]NMG15060.1 cytochrome C oxidase subunit II [Aromatoleum bremense]QTQ32232.1 Cytochrome coxidase, subunit II [Aromatoleum bremense]CAI08192.1 probable cytochrome-c oxidase subunit II [Aromatoleum aromaticum EbN1]